MMFLGLLVAYALRVNLSVGIVAMTDKNNANVDFPELPWDESIKSTILSSFFWGYLVMQIPAGMMSEKWGAKWLLAGSLGFCGVCTLLTPLAAIEGGSTTMIITRIAQGLAQGFIYPSVNAFMSKWAPPMERARLFSFAFSGTQFGNLVTLPVAGLLAGSPWGWPSIFYVSGAVAIVWAAAWCYIGANSPAQHPFISLEERIYIETSLVHSSTVSSSMKVPWKAILTSLPVWAVLITHLCQNWGYWTLLTEMPSYINSVLQFDIKSNGFLSAAPYLAQWILILVFSWLADYIVAKQILSPTVSRKMWNTIGLWGSAAALVGLSFVGDNLVGAITCLTLAIAINAGTYTGFLSNHLDLSPNFAGTLMGFTNGCANIASILGPLFVGFIVTDNTSVSQWQTIFLIAAAIFFFGNLIFLIFGTSEVQPWNDSEYDGDKKKSRK
ncbi:putative inorganic phosphate cotransporter [Diaphorina citri]|uniref:Putative inorganic phosphate cotransporter n=1 Tax=Diaphorina citri TaxID=121845 RepID=A0A1S4E6V2_DIACI|nr:putative inorganic phosphate cotransporter [Diaphorina citri]